MSDSESSDSDFENALLEADDPDYVESDENTSTSDEEKGAAPKIKRADPVRIWTVSSSSHVVPMGGAGSPSTAGQSKLLLESHQCREATYYCKICYMESTRPRQYALMPLSVAERHFYVHFHQGFLGNKNSTRTDRISFKFQVPEELRGKTSFINSDDDIAQLKDLYIGTLQTEDDEKPHSCDKLLRHMFEAHCDLEVKERYWKCSICTMQFQDRTDLEWHFYWHMKPAVKIGAASQKYSQGRPPSQGGSKDAGRPQFRCTICSYETIESTKVPLYTSAEAHDHLAWHWQNQRPPELPASPTLNFDKDSGAIHRLYMIPFSSNLPVTCKFCGMNITVEATCKHLESYHKHMIMDPHCCMRAECKHLQFSEKLDFFGHMFSQHVTIVKKNKEEEPHRHGSNTRLVTYLQPLWPSMPVTHRTCQPPAGMQ
ncbi:Cytochrome P450 3A4 [Branchiostoma belcheri]|nr:Cytochrome P450 3A4 [Branchiostoma belcheri]